jgi:hypothetical protein
MGLIIAESIAMIRIQLDRIHLELLLLAGLFATFSGVVFEPTWQSGMNVTPLVAFGGGLVVGVGVLVHRRIFGDSTDSRSRMRATIWFAFLGAVIGATVSSVVVGTPRSMVIAAAGGGLMFSAIGTQFGIVIKTRDEAARDAVETVLDEENVFVTPEHFWSDNTDTTHSNEDSRATEEKVTQTETHAVNGGETSDPDRNETSEESDNHNGDDTDKTGSDENDESVTDEQIDGDIERIDVSSSSDWKQTADDNIPIPVIRSIESSDYSEE